MACFAAASGCGVDELVPTDAAVDAPPEIDAEEYVPPPQRTIPGGNNGGYAARGVLRWGGHALPGELADWQGNPMWDALDFRILQRQAYQFAASSAGGFALTVTAVGDLDCDTTTSTITMSCTLTNDVVSCQLALPEIIE